MEYFPSEEYGLCIVSLLGRNFNCLVEVYNSSKKNFYYSLALLQLIMSSYGIIYLQNISYETL